MMFNSQSGIRDIASRGSKSVRSEDIVAVKVYGGYVLSLILGFVATAISSVTAPSQIVNVFNSKHCAQLPTDCVQ